MNEEQQDAVNEPVETTTPVESATTESVEAQAETTTEDTQSTPADASIAPEKKVSESVPYERFSKVNQEKKELEDLLKKVVGQGQPAPSQQPTDIPQLDPESELAVRHTIQRELEAQKLADFKRKNAKELDDPFLRAAVDHVVKEANKNGQYKDWNDALTEAKSMLEARLTPQIKQASEDGVQEGQELARKKLENAAIGTTTAVAPKMDDAQLTAEQFKQKYNVPRDTELAGK